MKTIALTTTLLAAVSFGSAHAARSVDSTKAAQALNSQAQKTLGVSVRSLAFLFEADPGMVLARNSVELQRDWKYLEALQAAGLVELRIFSGGQYVQIVRTPKGEEVMHSLYGP